MKRRFVEISRKEINIDEVVNDLLAAANTSNHHRVAQILNYCHKKSYHLGSQAACLVNGALETDDPELIRILISYDIFAQAEQFKRFSYLSTAARDNKINTLQLLLQHSEPGSYRYSFYRGRNILQEAILGNAKDALIFLIQKYAEDKDFLNHQDDFGDTPLHKAVFKNDVPSVNLLLLSKVDCTITNKRGLTAKDLAKNIPELLACFEAESQEKKSETLPDSPGPQDQNPTVDMFIKETRNGFEQKTMHQLLEENVTLRHNVATLETLVFDLHRRLLGVEQHLSTLPPSNQYFQVGDVNILANSLRQGIGTITPKDKPYTESATPFPNLSS